MPASADGPGGRHVTRRGRGPPTFAAPGAGAWTVEVHVVFGDGLGNASYFWRLEVGRLGGARGGRPRGQASLATGWPAEKIETWASSGSITPKTFWRASVCAHDPQLSK